MIGEQILCFDRCQSNITRMPNIKMYTVSPPFLISEGKPWELVCCRVTSHIDLHKKMRADVRMDGLNFEKSLLSSKSRREQRKTTWFFLLSSRDSRGKERLFTV